MAGEESWQTAIATSRGPPDGSERGSRRRSATPAGDGSQHVAALLAVHARDSVADEAGATEGTPRALGAPDAPGGAARVRPVYGADRGTRHRVTSSSSVRPRGPRRTTRTLSSARASRFVWP